MRFDYSCVSLYVLSRFAQREITDEWKKERERREKERTSEQGERVETARVRSNWQLKSLAAALGS